MRSYKFQNYVDVNIDSPKHIKYLKYFENEYRKVSDLTDSLKPAKTQITLHIVESLSKHGHDIKKEVRFKKLFSHQFAIKNLDGNDVDIYFKHHPISRIYATAVGVFIQAHVLESILYYKLLQQGVLLMHSSGVSRDKKGYLFPAYGGTGKTTLLLSLLANGYRFLGDDFVLVDPSENRVYPYPRPLHIFTYNVRNLNDTRIPIKTKAIIYFKNVARYFLELFLRTEFLISTRIHADEIIPHLKVSKPVKIHKVLFLKKDGSDEMINLSSARVIREHAKRITQAADLNQSLFQIKPEVRFIDEVEKMEIETASKILKRASKFGYVNTHNYNLDQPDDFIEILESKE